MFEKTRKLAKAIAVLNSAGMDMLINMAHDVASHERYRCSGIDLTVEQFNAQTAQVLAMVERGRKGVSM